MERPVSGALAALLTAGVMLAMSSVPAAAQTTGSETSDGTLVVSGTSGTRVELASVIRARGVFNGVGRIVEVQNLPGDPANVSRDDLVFSAGILHLVNVTLGFSFVPNQQNCLFRVTVQQTSTFDGGTGLFVNATGSGTGTVTGQGLARRNPDGSCAFDQAALIEVDTVAGSGLVSF